MTLYISSGYSLILPVAKNCFTPSRENRRRRRRAVQIVACQSWEPAKKEVQLEKWREEMEREKLRVKGILVVTDDTRLYKEIEQSETLRMDEVCERFQGYCHMAMDKAYEFYYADWKKFDWKDSDNIIITGHSKGGNKAQYTTIMSENGHLIDTCYSMDGQGFSPEAIAAFKEKYGEQGYRQILDKMYAINGNNDYVSPLLYPIISKENTTYLETTVSPDEGLGEELKGYHELKNFFQQKDGEYVSELVPSTDRKGPCQNHIYDECV